MTDSETGVAQNYEHNETPEEARLNRGYITLYEQTKETEAMDVGDRFVVLGHGGRRHIYDEESGEFVPVAVPLAEIELHKPIEEDEVEDWCNSQVGQMFLSQFYDDVEGPDVVTEWGEDRL